MKFTFILMTAVILQVSAASYGQNVNLSVKRASLEDVFSQLRKQSGYNFLYETDMLSEAKTVSINVKNKSLLDVLEMCFRNQPLTYSINQKNIVIRRKEASVNELARAADITVTGTISDENGLPLPGAGIHFKTDNANGTITDKNGNFTIKASAGQVLVISYVGYQAREVTIKDNEALTISLVPSATALTEVIATGYGSQKRSDIISSIGTVNITDLKKAPVSSFEDALAGRVAGVQVVSSEGGPFSTNAITIRGANSLTQDNSPLWVIDGFPLESPANNTINPADIESITILKDAASTAIYGSRGANGVVLVTTKKGKNGPPVVAFDGYYGIQKTLKLMDLLNPYQYVQLQIERVGTGAKQLYTPGDPSLGALTVPGGRTIDYYQSAPYNDWQKLLYRKAPMQSYTLSLSGGTDKTKYLFSGSMTDQEGTIIETGNKRYQGRFVLTQQINKKTNFNLNVNYANTATQGGSPSSLATNAASSLSLLYAVWGYRPAISSNSTIEDQLNSGIDPDGELAYTFNPILSQKNTIQNTSNNNLAANSYLDYKIFKDLSLRISGGINYTQAVRNLYAGANTQSGQPTSILGPNGSIANSKALSLLNENTLTYNKVFNETHTLNVLAGFSYQKTNVNASSLAASQVPNDALGVSGLDEGTPYSIGSSSSNNFLSSYFGRVNYNYKSRYYLSGTVRADGSSKFAPGHKWGYFPSAAVAWNILGEDFMKKFTYVSELKLRGSYGTSGNNRVNDFAYLSPISLSNINNNYAFGNSYSKGAVQPTLGNQDLKWETTATTDIGLDLSFISNRVEFIADYYRKVTSNLLLQATLPGHLGYTTGIENIGSVSNTGWEFTLNTVNVTNKQFSWNSNFNISFNKGKVLALSSGQNALVSQVSYATNPAFPYIAMLGGPIAQIIGYKWVGNYQYSDFDKLPNGTYQLKANVPATGANRTANLPGDIKYEDVNGDGIINASDQVIIGNPNPLFTGGFSNDFSYKWVDLSILFTFSEGNDILNANRLVFETAPDSYANQFATMANRWTPENQNNIMPRAGGATTIPAVSSRVVEDGSFIRLKTISLGYKLPQSLLKKIQVKSARIYCSAQNIAIWDKYQGSDPEVSVRPGALTPGVDFAAYPRAFTLVFGFNFSF